MKNLNNNGYAGALEITHEIPGAPAPEYVTDKLSKATNDYFQNLEEGIFFQRGDYDFIAVSMPGHELKKKKNKGRRESVKRMTANDVYNRRDKGFIEDVGTHYIKDGSLFIFVDDTNTGKHAATTSLVYHPKLDVIEFALSVVNGDYRHNGIGGMFLKSSFLLGDHLGAHFVIAKGSGYKGVKQFLENGLANPKFREYGEVPPEIRGIALGMGYRTNVWLSYDMRKHPFYKGTEIPPRRCNGKDDISITLLGLEDWEILFFGRKLNEELYRKTHEELSSFFGSKNERT